MIVKECSATVIFELIVDKVAFLYLFIVHLQANFLLEELVQIKLKVIVLFFAEINDLVVDVDVNGRYAIVVLNL